MVAGLKIGDKVWAYARQAQGDDWARQQFGEEWNTTMNLGVIVGATGGRGARKFTVDWDEGHPQSKIVSRWLVLDESESEDSEEEEEDSSDSEDSNEEEGSGSESDKDDHSGGRGRGRGRGRGKGRGVTHGGRAQTPAPSTASKEKDPLKPGGLEWKVC